MTKDIRNAALLALIDNSADYTKPRITKSLQLNRNTYYVLFRVYQNGEVKKYFRSTGIKNTKPKKKAEDNAKEKMEQMYQELKLELIAADVNISNPLFVDYMENYINNIRVSPTTIDGYRHMFNKYMKPYFKKLNLYIADIKPLHIEGYYNYLQDKCKLSSNTARKHHQLIHVCLNDACDNDIIDKNPDDKSKKPKCRQSKNDFYVVEEIKMLLDVSKGTALEMPIYLAVFFGLRRSEVLGMRWSAIDFSKGTIDVCNTVTRQKVNGKLKAVSSNDMKTKTSKKTYYLSGEEGQMHIDYLKRMKEKQDGYCRLSDEHKDFVCVNELGKRLEPDYVSSAFSKLLEDNGLRHIRFHDLRHSCISLIVLNPAFTMKHAQDYARHASYQTTADIYAHLLDTECSTELSAITNDIGHEL